MKLLKSRCRYPVTLVRTANSSLFRSEHGPTHSFPVRQVNNSSRGNMGNYYYRQLQLRLQLQLHFYFFRSHPANCHRYRPIRRRGPPLFVQPPVWSSAHPATASGHSNHSLRGTPFPRLAPNRRRPGATNTTTTLNCPVPCRSIESLTNAPELRIIQTKDLRDHEAHELDTTTVRQGRETQSERPGVRAVVHRGEQ